MENKKSKRFSRSQLNTNERNKINNLQGKLKCMPISELEKFPLYKSGDGITQYNHGQLIRYKNGSILYIMENQNTHEKVPTLITVIKDLKVLTNESKPLKKKGSQKTKTLSKSVKINNKPTIINSEDALKKFNEYYEKIKNNNDLIIPNINFIGNELFIDKVLKNKITINDGNESELDFDEEEEFK